LTDIESVRKSTTDSADTCVSLTIVALTIVAPAVVGLTAGTANARPRDMQCLAYAKAMDQSTQLAHIAYEQGDKKMGDYYGEVADRAYANLVNRKCLS